MPGRSVGSTQLMSVGPGFSATLHCEPATVANDRLGSPIGIKDLDSGEQCSWVGWATRSVNNLGCKDVSRRIEGNAVFLSYWPVVTLPNKMTINRESIVIIPSNDDFCGDGVYATTNIVKDVAELASGVGGFCGSRFIPNPMGTAEV